MIDRCEETHFIMSAMTPPKRRIARPLGVSLLSIFDAIVLGIIPLVTLVIIFQNEDVSLNLFGIILTVALSITIMTASLLAFLGDNIARLVLLLAITISSVVMILSNIGYLMGEDATEIKPLRLIGNIFRGLFWIGINWWYFNRKETLEYYKQEARK